MLVHFSTEMNCMEVRLAKEAQQASEEVGHWQVVGKLLSSDGDVVDALLDDVAWVGGKVLHPIAILHKRSTF